MAADEIRASNAALIVTFYGPSAAGTEARLESMVMHLVTRLSMQSTRVPDHWQNLTPDHEVFLHRFDLAAATDTTVLQLAINEPGAASKSWDVLRCRLDAILNENLFKSIWGYTLIYQAEIDEIESSVVELKVGNQLLQAARRPKMHAAEVTWIQPLAKTCLPGGTIWLVDVPKNDSLAAATVYTALSHPGSGNQLVAEYLYGPGATLLMPDLIAHKGYFQARQYQGAEFQEKYAQHLNTMRATTHIQVHRLGEHGRRISMLEDLARDYGYLVDTLSQLERLRVALARQLYNYGWWQREAASDQILLYHRTFLETALAEIQLLVEEGKGALEAAGTAVAMVQTRLENERQRQQEVLNTILAILAVALALPQILDREVLRAILTGMGIPVGDGLQGTVWLFGVQAVVILVVMIVAGLLVRVITKKQKERR